MNVHEHSNQHSILLFFSPLINSTVTVLLACSFHKTPSLEFWISRDLLAHNPILMLAMLQANYSSSPFVWLVNSIIHQPGCDWLSCQGEPVQGNFSGGKKQINMKFLSKVLLISWDIQKIPSSHLVEFCCSSQTTTHKEWWIIIRGESRPTPSSAE